MAYNDLIRRGDALAAVQAAYDDSGFEPDLADAAARIAALPAVTVGVKPLVWEAPCARNNHTHIARSIFGDYYIHIDGGRHQAWLEAHTKPYENTIGDVVGSLYAAQALAQSDYEARIRAALEPLPALDLAAIRAAALRKAADRFSRLAALRKMWTAAEIESTILALIDKETGNG